MSKNLEQLILAEKYRPKSLDDCILPSSVKEQIQKAIESGNIPNFLFYGTAGTGKTSTIQAIANDLDYEMLYINAGLERSIDVIRNRVIGFASAVSLSGNGKIVLFDEADSVTKQSMDSLKGIIEQFTNVRFCFTSNHINKISDPIRSRCVNIDFNIPAAEQPALMAAFFKRVIYILETENIEFDQKAVAGLIKKFFPDFRRTLNELQRYSVIGKIDMGILTNTKDLSYDELFDAMRDKKFTVVRQWVAANQSIEPPELFRTIYDRADDLFELSSIPDIVLILDQYGYKAAFSVDLEILMTAALTEIMVGAVWKQ